MSIPILICPGIHSPDLTVQFLAGLQIPGRWLVVPSASYPVYSPQHILAFLQDMGLVPQPLVIISFSAGVVGAIGAARQWQRAGGTIPAFFALDGWGVPLVGGFPQYRLSHDSWTDWSSALLGRGRDRFYADPPVAHLTLWQAPQTVQGHWVRHTPTGEHQVSTTAAQFLRDFLDPIIREDTFAPPSNP